MKKLVLILVLAVLLVGSLAFVNAAVISKGVDKNGDTKTINKEITTNKGYIVMTKTITRSCDNETGECVREMTKYITIERTKGNETIIKVKNITVTTTAEIEVDEENNKTYMKISKDKRKEIKIMPDTASERAIEVLKSKNITIELKDTGKYHVNAEKKAKLLGFIKKKMRVRAEIDAETGEIKIKKPWWAFLAKEE